jgi:hypothetical protein
METGTIDGSVQPNLEFAVLVLLLWVMFAVSIAMSFGRN